MSLRKDRYMLYCREKSDSIFLHFARQVLIVDLYLFTQYEQHQNRDKMKRLHAGSISKENKSLTIRRYKKICRNSSIAVYINAFRLRSLMASNK